MNKMDKKQLKILMIDDNPGDIRLIQEMLVAVGDNLYELRHADCLTSGLKQLEKNDFDIILLDLGLPESQGLSTLNRITPQTAEIPIVVLTGSINDDMVGISAVQEGAQDYLTKGYLDGKLLVRSIHYAIERKKLQKELILLNKSLEQRVKERTSALKKVNEKLLIEIAERREMVNQLQKLSYAIEQSPSIFVITDPGGNIQYVNLKFTQLTGYAPEEVIGKNPRFLKSGKTPQEEYKHLWETIIHGGEWRGEIVNKKKNGELYCELAYISPIRNTEGGITNFLKIAEDITVIKQVEKEKESLKEQLYHAQKLESVGTLAGGIAHDFNHILALIIGYADLLEKELKQDDSSLVYVQKILESAKRATNFIQDLLTFSRKQTHNPKLVNLDDIIKRTETFLLRLIREDIKLKIELSDKECMVMADSNQIEQVLINLTANARDAMPDGGLMTIRTEIVKLDNEFIKTYGYSTPRMYALISFSDTGVGMDEQIQKRIFEPFFTTKEIGKGTGLGLSIVYGLIIQHRGYIRVHSELNKGTTFKIYLPIVESMVEETKSVSLPIIHGGKETILLAEDDAETRKLTKMQLEESGYKVIEAIDGWDAVNKFRENKDTIHLFITDVLMPNLNGKDAYLTISKAKPDIKVVFMSSYPEDFINKKRILGEGVNYVLKTD